MIANRLVLVFMVTHSGAFNLSEERSDAPAAPIQIRKSGRGSCCVGIAPYSFLAAHGGRAKAILEGVLTL